MIFTYNLWLCLTLLYLVVAATLITWSIFHPRHPLAAQPTQVVHNQRGLLSHPTTNVSASFAATLARRDMARRALTVRLLGYILVPTISVVSGMVLDILGETKSGANIPMGVTITVAALAGLMGTLNAVLFGFDPSVLAVLHALRLQRAQFRRQQATPAHTRVSLRRNPRVFGSEIEKQMVGNTNPRPNSANDVTTGDLDSYLEAGSGHSFGIEDRDRHYPGPYMGTDTVDEDYRGSVSTIGNHVDEILETYRGL